MKNLNICKFITDESNDRFSVSRFIYESDIDVIEKKTSLKANRATLIASGEGTFCLSDDTVKFAAGDIIFGFSGETIYAQSSKCTYMYIEFTGSRSNELFRRFNITKKNRIFKGFDGIIPLWKESLSRASRENIDLATESMLLYCFSRLVSTDSQRNSLINKIIKITEEGFTSPDLSISTIAEELGYNAKYISFIFKKKTGISFSEHLTNLRIKYAVSLFEHGIDSIKNVALLSGFSDPLYFSTVFKKSVGISPKAYLSGIEKAALKSL